MKTEIDAKTTFFGFSAQNDAEWWSTCPNLTDVCVPRDNWAVLTASTPPKKKDLWWPLTNPKLTGRTRGIDFDRAPARDLPPGTDFDRFRFPDLARFLAGPVFDQCFRPVIGPWETLRLDPQLENSAPGLALLGQCFRVGRGRNSFRIGASADLI